MYKDVQIFGIQCYLTFCFYPISISYDKERGKKQYGFHVYCESFDKYVHIYGYIICNTCCSYYSPAKYMEAKEWLISDFFIGCNLSLWLS